LEVGVVQHFDIAFDSGSDTTSYVFQVISGAKIFDIHKGSEEQIMDDLKKGRITAILDIQKNDTGKADYVVDIKTSSAHRRISHFKEHIEWNPE
jgi:ABC-2 type transport system permease protein